MKKKKAKQTQRSPLTLHEVGQKQIDARKTEQQQQSQLQHQRPANGGKDQGRKWRCKNLQND
jgi:hypothetical protein